MIMMSTVLVLAILASVSEGAYKRIVKGCVGGHNIILYRDRSVSECEKLCDANDRCVAFEYGMPYGGRSYRPRDCQLQSGANYKGCNGAYYNLDLYVRQTYQRFARSCVGGHNIKLYRNQSVRQCENLCNAYGPGCKGFEYGMNYGGRSYRPRDCQLQSSSNRGGCNGSYYNLDFYTKPAPPTDNAATNVDLPAYVPGAFNDMISLSASKDCYAFSVDTGILARKLYNVVEPSIGGYVCENPNWQITNGELGITVGGCFKHIGQSVKLVNGHFRYPIVDFTADVCTVLSFGYGKAVTMMAKSMVKSAAKNFVKRAGPWAQRKAATAGQYSAALRSGKYGMKGQAAHAVGRKMYNNALKEVIAPALPPKGDCMALFNALKSQQDMYFCLIRKAAAATGHHYLRDAVNGIQRFQNSLAEGLKYMRLDVLLPSNNIGVRLDLDLNVNNMGVSLYFGFNIEMALFNHGRAAAAIASRLGQSCSQVRRQVCRKVTIKGWDWLGNAINKGVKWVCDTVFDTVCKAFEITADVCGRVGDLVDWMPKLKYSYSNLKIAGPVATGDVLDFTRMPNNRDLQAAGMYGRRLMEDGEVGENIEDAENYVEKIFDSLKVPFEGLKVPENADEDLMMAEVNDDDLPVDEESEDVKEGEDEESEDVDEGVNIEELMDIPEDVDYDEEEHFMCAEHGTESECAKMSVCVWSHHGCVAEFEEDEDMSSENEDDKVLDADVKSLEHAEKKWRNSQISKTVSQRTLKRKVKKVGRALTLANCDLELTFKGGAGGVWENEKFEEVGATSGEGDVPHEAVALLDAVLDLTAKKGLRGSAKCRRLGKLAEKMNSESGLFEIRVGSQGETGERRRMEGEAGEELLDARLYDCVVRWGSLSEEHKERCRQRASQISL